ncbi:MAG TPA: bifunctional DNA-formamidopyrimidine glycosylase/DNA-(apurinic or apyrimidinic site) lyase [Gemmatimonadales bacterium]|nr:bifunctional DNA-formamidopyrimidine glycosylase/DNA-(apurinic or apyrimidinic site) lyase [Gemmatimonadales bacterium]
MPELPEVETIVRDIRPGLVGRRIESAALSHSDVLDGITRRRLLSRLTGATITDVTRRAKHAIIHLDSGERLVIQPGMTGSLMIHRRPLNADEQRYAVLNLKLHRAGRLVYRDVRRLGTIRLLTPKQWDEYAARLGPEPLDPAFTAADMAASFRKSRQAIKKVLMDQRYVVGVGNIYANEALFAAGIDPSRRADRIPADAYERLHRETRRILTEAIESQGTTFRDYRTGTGEAGAFQFALKVYGREGEPCTVCGTRLTGTHTIDARITVFCHRCQA